MIFRWIVVIAAVVAAATNLRAAPSLEILQVQKQSTKVERLALVIGNSTYKNVPALRNTRADATSVAKAMQKLGFETFFAQDLDRRDMNDVISRFLQRIEPGMEAVIYYAGHGVEMQGSNYLLPIDVPSLGADQERLLRNEGINLTELLQDVQGRSTRVALVILDACRDNPFPRTGRRSLGTARGLGNIVPPQGSFVVYAAGAGEQALDSLGPDDRDPNGLFTREFLKLLNEEGLELRSMVRRLRGQVREIALNRANHSQIPSYYDQMLGDFYFRVSPTGSDLTECDKLVDPQASRDALKMADVEVAMQACMKAVERSPNEPRFRRLLDAAQDQRAFRKTVESQDPAMADAYLALFPNGRFAQEVRDHIALLDAAARQADQQALRQRAETDAAARRKVEEEAAKNRGEAESVSKSPDAAASAEAAVKRGNSLLEDQRFADAIAEYNEAIRLKPDLAEAFWQRARALNALGKFSDAINDATRAVTIRPDRPEGYLFRARSEGVLKGKEKLALQDYDKAISLKPDYALALAGRCEFLSYAEQYERASKDCEQAIRLKQDTKQVLVARGVLNYTRQNYDKALKDIDEALAIAPNYFNAFMLRALVLASKDQLDPALTNIERAIAIAPTYQTYYIRGVLYHLKGQNERALEDFKRTLELSPEVLHVIASIQRDAAQAAESSLKLDAGQRKAIQTGLTSLGFDTRGADGVFGVRSREMITQWQRTNNLLETGFLTSDQAQTLQQTSSSNAGTPAPSPQPQPRESAGRP